MKHKHSAEKLLSSGRWILSPKGEKMIARVEKRKLYRKSKKKKAR